MPPRRLRQSIWTLLAILASAPAFVLGSQTGHLPAEPPPQASITTPPLIIDSLGKGTAPLDGPWQFQLGDNPAWSASAFDDSPWEQLTADQPWGAQGHEGYTGFAWYRRRITLTPVPGAQPNFSLLIESLDDAYELYWNGQLIGSNGKLPPHAAWYRNQPPQIYGLGPARTGVLAVRVWKAPLASFDSDVVGGFEAPPVVGSPEAIAARKAAFEYRWLRGIQSLFALSSLYALVALLSLLAWFRDRRQWIFLCMSGFCLAPMGALVLDGAMFLHWPFNIELALDQPVYAIQDISLWFLLVSLLQLHQNRRLVRVVRIAAVINLAAYAVDGILIFWFAQWARPQQIADALLTAVYTLIETLPLVLVGFAVARRKQLDVARWMVAILAFLTEMLSVLQVAVQQGSRFTHWTFGDWFLKPLFTLDGNPIQPYTAASTLLLFSIVYAVYRHAVENSRRQNALEQEFKSARELQQLLIPESLPKIPGFTLTSAYRPALEVGGDFFQIVPLADSSTLVILGDVSGKGLKAAMTVSLIVGAIRALADDHPNPAHLLARLNRSLHGRMQGGFATCTALRLTSEGSCQITSAGHPGPFLNGREVDLPGALPLGLTPEVEYQEAALVLQPGDRLALFTDGLLEARNASGELYGFERLQVLFASRPSAEQATEAAVAFGQDDDITVLTLTRLQPA